ncbi:MAG: PD-(D/E)XK nuclease family protein [Leptolyngbya sp. SIO1E4]|nr:PD-(D/E)XK nuclease family protein [Leptolyngbya sp. SIO1E4]
MTKKSAVSPLWRISGETWSWSDRTFHPEHHQFQLWAYSQATAKPNAHIAYLRHDLLYTFTSTQLSELESSASKLINGLMKSDFIPNPSETNCGICPYAEVCDHH